MTIQYYCVECGAKMEIDELDREDKLRVVFFLCPHCSNDKFEIYEV